MADKVYIAGAGGFAIEVYNWFASSPSYKDRFEFAGFIDDFGRESCILKRTGLDNIYDNGALIKIKDYRHKDGDRVLLALGTVEAKKEYLKALDLNEEAYLTFVHDSSIIGSGTALGRGVIIGPFCMIESNVSIGDFSSLNVYCFAAHDVKIGRCCSLSPRSTVLGGCEVGNDCFIGAGAVINIKRQVGDGSFVGMSSSVIHNVEPLSKVYGVPAMPYTNRG